MAATRKSKWYASCGIDGREALRLERALYAIADNEGTVAMALRALGSNTSHEDICAALRYIVDGWEKQR